MTTKTSVFHDTEKLPVMRADIFYDTAHMIYSKKERYSKCLKSWFGDSYNDYGSGDIMNVLIDIRLHAEEEDDYRKLNSIHGFEIIYDELKLFFIKEKQEDYDIPDGIANVIMTADENRKDGEGTYNTAAEFVCRAMFRELVS